jgi:hypothetical protein
MATMSTRKDPKNRVAVVMDTLTEQVESMSDQEVLDDAAAEGIDVTAEGDRVRGLLLGAVVSAKKERLAHAMEAHRTSVAALAHRAVRIPSDPSDRRALLMRSLERRPQMREAVVTLQHRDFGSFSDADVESALKQLDILGLLDDEFEPKP